MAGKLSSLTSKVIVFKLILLDYLISYSKSINLKTITLEVNELNLPAIKLYKKFAFSKLGIRKKYYNGENDAIIMRKSFKQC